MRKLFRTIIILFIITLVVIPLACYQITKTHAKDLIYDNVEEIPYNKVALLLGTTPQTRDGSGINMFFVYRLIAVEQLFKAGRVDYILISGDENSLDGVNEPECMKDSLVARGIPASRILLDGKGFRTIDSIVRGNKFYGLENFTIVSQKFHNERALYLSNHLQLPVRKVIAFNAKSPITRKTYITYIREYFARVKMFLDIYNIFN